MPQPVSPNPGQPTRKVIGSSFVELQSVDSTNNYARNLLHNACLAPQSSDPEHPDHSLHGSVFFAHEQIAGKAQRGKVWTSEKDANIILSILIDPAPLAVTDQFQLSALAAVAIHEFFIRYTRNDACIKWPNDLYWKDRKAGGVLIENIIGKRDQLAPDSYRDGRQQSAVGSQQLKVSNRNTNENNWQWSIIGIGININQVLFPPEIPNPVSLKQITGKNYNTVTLAKELCVVFNKYFQQLINFGFEKIFDQYQNILYKKNEKIRLKKESRVFEAMILGVSRIGQLMTRHSLEENFEFGEVEWVI